MQIHNYETKSDTEAVLYIQGSVPWFTAWNQFRSSHANCNVKYTFYLF